MSPALTLPGEADASRRYSSQPDEATLTPKVFPLPSPSRGCFLQRADGSYSGSVEGEALLFRGSLGELLLPSVDRTFRQ